MAAVVAGGWGSWCAVVFVLEWIALSRVYGLDVAVESGEMSHAAELHAGLYDGLCEWFDDRI